MCQKDSNGVEFGAQVEDQLKQRDEEVAGGSVRFEIRLWEPGDPIGFFWVGWVSLDGVAPCRTMAVSLERYFGCRQNMTNFCIHIKIIKLALDGGQVFLFA